ncbi:MAG: DnaJ domain-containing protein [Candidatus Limnocylindrales bacterium]
MSHRTDHYRALGVPPSATPAQIRRAFRSIARASHPDVHPGDPDAERGFMRASRAYEVLSDPARRAVYDARHVAGRFAGPGMGGQASFAVDEGPVYHSDLGHHSDFYQAGDPLTIAEAAALVGRNPSWLRRAVRDRRLPATRADGRYLLRRRDVEGLDRTAARRPRQGFRD